jgi:hypothetical protein
VAYDNAADPAYGQFWPIGSNGGFGFGAWQLTSSSNSQEFIGSSANNGNAPSGNIDTSGKSWGIFSHSGQPGGAVRPFTAGPLEIGQHVTLDFDSGFLAPGGGVGVDLQSNSSPRLRWSIIGGAAGTTPRYVLADNSGNRDSGLNLTTDGMHLDFALTGTDAYEFDVTPAGASTIHYTGTLQGAAGAGIDSVRFFNISSGNGASFDPYFNSLAVTPEPVVLSFVGLGALVVSCRARRRRRRPGA